MVRMDRSSRISTVASASVIGRNGRRMEKERCGAGW